MILNTLPHKVYRVVASLVAVTAMFSLFPQTVHAIPRSLQQLNIDISIVQDDKAFSTPGRIVILPIFPPQSEFPVQDEAWYRGLHYFMIANDQRSGFTDVPFHYAVSREGSVFRGNVGGEERKITIKDLGDDMV